MKRIIPVLLASLTLFVGCSSKAQKTKSKPKSEQTSFSAEEPIEHPVKIPKAVLESLRQSAPDSCFKNPDRKGNITAWFSASAIDLNDDGLADLVVKPENACLFGANIGPFWIFRNSGDHYEDVLETSSLGLTVLDTKTNGYRDIVVDAFSATMIFETQYAFDGKKYSPATCSEQSIDDAQHGDKGKSSFKCD